MQQQRVEEQLTAILQRLEAQKAESDKQSEEQRNLAQERHTQLQQQLRTEVAGLRDELQQQGHKLEGQKACYE